MKVIHKLAIEVNDFVVLRLPHDAQILYVGSQLNDPMKLSVWYLCEPSNEKWQRLLRIAGTGQELPDSPGRYISTVIIKNIVWHLFEVDIIDSDRDITQYTVYGN